MKIKNKNHIVYDGEILLDLSELNSMLSENNIKMEKNSLEIIIDKTEAEKIVKMKKIPSYLPIEIQKEWALRRINKVHSNMLKELSGNESTTERTTWATQLEAAKAFINNKADESQNKMLSYLLTNGETKTSLSKLIIEKHSKIQKLIGIAGGLKRKTKLAIKNTEKIEQVYAVLDKSYNDMEIAINNFKKSTGEQ